MVNYHRDEIALASVSFRIVSVQQNEAKPGLASKWQKKAMAEEGAEEGEDAGAEDQEKEEGIGGGEGGRGFSKVL